MAFLAVGPVGCSRFKPSGPPAMGTVTFMLSATGASGTVYRLRAATFMVVGPENKSIVGPTDPADTSAAITTQFRPGLYQITLATGWKMYRIPMAGTPVEVPASLISPATASFTVVSGQDSKVFYQFDVAGDTMVPGTLTIGIGVTEMDGGVDGATAGSTGAAGAAAGSTGSAGAAGGAAGAAGGAGGAAGAAAGATGAAGTGGAAGASACGNGILDPGEQCDNAAAFANNTCDHTTCQNISVVCGNHLVQTGEQCDDGPSGSATCSTTCMTIASASMCLTCETQGTTAGLCFGTKYAPSSTIVGCGGLPTTDAQTKCKTLLACLQTHPSCSISPIDDGHMVVNNDPTACFCGALDPASCSGATPNNLNGLCTDAYFAVYGKTKATATSDDRATVLGDWDNRALPVGIANHLYACDVTNNCQSKCP
jgi:hypothetical protein